jgi:hypothetical protein
LLKHIKKHGGVLGSDSGVGGVVGGSCSAVEQSGEVLTSRSVARPQDGFVQGRARRGYKCSTISRPTQLRSTCLMCLYSYRKFCGMMTRFAVRRDALTSWVRLSINKNMWPGGDPSPRTIRLPRMSG